MKLQIILSPIPIFSREIQFMKLKVQTNHLASRQMTQRALIPKSLAVQPSGNIFFFHLSEMSSKTNNAAITSPLSK